MKRAMESRWLVLIHRLPPKPSYLRVKIGRLLGRIGSVAVKNAVYVLPRNDEAQEHYQWMVKTIVQEGGEATVFEANFVEGLKDVEVEHLFRDARDQDYRNVIKQGRRLQSLGSLPAVVSSVRSEATLGESCGREGPRGGGRPMSVNRE